MIPSRRRFLRHRRAVMAAALPCLGAVWLACSPEAPSDPAGPARLQVVASVPPLAHFVERLGEGLVDVAVMLPPGANPVTYSPSVVELQALERADLFVKVGHPHFPFERAWLAPLLADRDDLVIVDASADNASRADDPHVWLAPAQVSRIVDRLEQALAGLLPDHVAELAARARSFRDEIQALDGELARILEPLRGRHFFVHHPAWGYFAEAYGLEQVSIEQAHKGPDARSLGFLIEHGAKSGIRAVFVQPQFDDQAARTVAGELRVRVEPLDPMARDWAANLRHVAGAIAESLAP